MMDLQVAVLPEKVGNINVSRTFPMEAVSILFLRRFELLQLSISSVLLYSTE
jgi:hypothetical protein